MLRAQGDGLADCEGSRIFRLRTLEVLNNDIEEVLHEFVADCLRVGDAVVGEKTFAVGDLVRLMGALKT